MLVESIVKCYDHVRGLSYTEKPDYDYIKQEILDELRKNKLPLNAYSDWALKDPINSSYAYNSCFENEDDIKKRQSLFKRAKHENIENESYSMEVDY